MAAARKHVQGGSAFRCSPLRLFYGQPVAGFGLERSGIIRARRRRAGFEPFCRALQPVAFAFGETLG